MVTSYRPGMTAQPKITEEWRPEADDMLKSGWPGKVGKAMPQAAVKPAKGADGGEDE